MTGAAELVRRLAEREPIPADLVDGIDPFEVGALAVRLLAWPALPDVGQALSTTADVGPCAGALAAPRAGSVPPSVFVRALLADDPAAVDLAANVDVLALGLLCVVILGWPALRDPMSALETFVLADRSRSLGEGA